MCRVAIYDKNIYIDGGSSFVRAIKSIVSPDDHQGFIFRLTCSYPELTEDHVLTSAYVKIFGTDTKNAVNKNV